VEMARGIWNPTMLSWRDIIEDYLYISKKRIDNKWSMFKLQLNIFQDIVGNIKAIDDYKKLVIKNTKDEKEGTITRDDFENEKEHINSQIYSHTIINKALREIVDGIVWKYFSHSRAILYMLADKQPIETIRPDEGTINNLYEFADVFLEDDAVAIYNDITNFLRIGDVTKINKDNTIEIIEVKANKKRGGRIIRQKDKMSEIVEFFNTGFTNYDGKILKIVNSNLKQTNYLSLLRNAIQKAKHHGFESLLIGKYLILEIIDLSKGKGDKSISYFESRHKSVREEWERGDDFIHPYFFIDKMDYSKNCAPFSIYPFDIETCADIMMGKIMIRALFNFTEVLRIIKRAGWNIDDALILRSENEIKSLKGKEIKDVSFLKVSKGPLIFDVPPSFIARIQFELLSPTTMIGQFEELYNKGPQKEFEYLLTNYTDEQRIWH
jgi:hypothetical protein